MSSTRARAAFTLIELLVVIAIIALLIGILLPSLRDARRAAMNAKSLSNLRSLGQTMFLYTNDYNDYWMTPFNPKINRWYGAGVPDHPGSYWAFRDPPRYTEMFGAHAVSLLLHHNAGSVSGLTSKVQFAPGDRTVLERFRTHMDENGNLDRWIWDGSYWYPPTFWLDARRYQSASVEAVTQDMLQPQSIPNVVFPTAKVLLFERFDFTRDRRRAPGGGRAPFSPQWNNVESVSRFMTTDGSASEIHIDELVQLSQSPKPAVSRAFTPSGLWDISTSTLRRYSMDGDDLENGDNDTIAYPAWFWATRDGIRGRDLYR